LGFRGDETRLNNIPVHISRHPEALDVAPRDRPNPEILEGPTVIELQKAPILNILQCNIIKLQVKF
jgi:hypothetical protein